MSKELFVFKACPVFITGAQKLSSSELSNCFSNAEDKQKFFAIWVGYLFPVALPSIFVQSPSESAHILL